MVYFLAIICPPLAVLIKGKPISALINLFLCFLFWIPGVIHAFAIINSADADKRNNKMIKAIKDQQKTI
jgi:uncharacterized membrane protein YqaE (UPF0057 family)